MCSKENNLAWQGDGLDHLRDLVHRLLLMILLDLWQRGALGACQLLSSGGPFTSMPYGLCYI